jgi:hypothetical protein
MSSKNEGGGNIQSSHQISHNVNSEKGKDVVGSAVSSTSISDDLSESFATKIHKTMGPSSAAGGGNTESSSSRGALGSPVAC